jgi:hypothetical protein
MGRSGGTKDSDAALSPHLAHSSIGLLHATDAIPH